MQALCVLAGWVSMVAFVAWVYAVLRGINHHQPFPVLRRTP